MLLELLLFLISINLNLTSEIVFEKFLKDNPKIHEKLSEINIQYKNAKNAFVKCGKNEGKYFVDNTPFIIEQGNICKGKVSILVAVHSNTPNSFRRQIIRETYGSVHRIGSFIIRFAFFVGKSSDEIEQSNLFKENEINGDIVQRDFIESYRNMTRKHLSVIEWVTHHCSHAEYLVKTDDDVFIDMYHVIREISDGRAKQGFLCSNTKNARPQRSQKGNLKKWFVTKEEYKNNFYPAYCEGYGYILPMKFVPQLFSCSIFNNFFWIDDVHVGGVLPDLLGIPRINFTPGGGFFYMLPSHASHKILDGIFFVAYYSEIVQHQWRKMWKAVVDYSMNIY